MSDEISLYERVGGTAFFEHLVDTFYEGVATDAALASLYPEFPDFTGARHRLTLFLVQYWGGPTTYSDERGHPKLRMRHFPFHIGADRKSVVQGNNGTHRHGRGERHRHRSPG